ncbi:hypothetical protein PTTG_12473 [Puccinia triticina 1-1 BBBD Race 1]|uniref:Uncharacterized protein n=1 Tax=Puccinia triticina (isolate 1-1 / race 1 (BBBD)) TaxID=630390 RepID=A0A180GBJ2_PUCT1|nr:hypothetical protein PTTG_12473 [Puccinia triticina 1-1 BBBD Race 1]
MFKKLKSTETLHRPNQISNHISENLAYSINNISFPHIPPKSPGKIRLGLIGPLIFFLFKYYFTSRFISTETHNYHLIVVGLLCTITHVLGLDHFPHMTLNFIEGDQHIGVHYSMTMNREDFRYRRLNRKELYGALKKKSYAGKEAVLGLEESSHRPGENKFLFN